MSDIDKVKISDSLDNYNKYWTLNNLSDEDLESLSLNLTEIRDRLFEVQTKVIAVKNSRVSKEYVYK